jgi:hypothetical protein
MKRPYARLRLTVVCGRCACFAGMQMPADAAGPKKPKSAARPFESAAKRPSEFRMEF